MKPTIGRIVTYRSLKGRDYAAIITATHDNVAREPAPDEGHVRLNVFWDGDAPDWINDGGVPEDTDGVMPDGEHKPGHWRWPERV